MTKIWEITQVGDTKLDEKYFDEWFYQTFTESTHLPDIIGTDKGWHTNDGNFKLGDFKSHLQSFATSQSHPHSTNQRNLETQYYPSPNQHPTAPDPLHNLKIDNNQLVLSSYRLAEENEWARVKGYAIRSNQLHGRWEMTIDEAKAKGVYEKWAGHADGDRAYFHNMPADFVSPMISTYGRMAMSFGRYEAELELPVGATGVDMNDLRKTLTHFPAFWLYGNIPPMMDLNGNYNGVHPTQTHTPGNIIGDGNLPEIDMVELFGYMTKSLKVTTHTFSEKDKQFISKGKEIQLSKGSHEKMIIGVDVLPGSIEVHVDGVVVYKVATPDTIANPLYNYVPGGDPYNPQLPKMKNGKAVTDGHQTYADGAKKYTMWCPIFNIAQNAQFTRYFARQALNNGHDIPWSDNCEMRIGYIKMSPLAVDNPDTHRVWDNRESKISPRTKSGPIEIVSRGSKKESTIEHAKKEKTAVKPAVESFLRVTNETDMYVEGEASKNFIGRQLIIKVSRNDGPESHLDSTVIVGDDGKWKAHLGVWQTFHGYVNDPTGEEATTKTITRSAPRRKENKPIEYLQVTKASNGKIEGIASEAFIGRGVYLPIGDGITAHVDINGKFAVDVNIDYTRTINAYVETADRTINASFEFEYVV